VLRAFDQDNPLRRERTVPLADPVETEPLIVDPRPRTGRQAWQEPPPG
jgi:hypothetical protein